mgnify:CR=1 FL=1
MDDILKIRGLTKIFGQTIAVDNVDMNIKRGDIYGFIGRNGAGKTTLIRILLGLCEKRSGDNEKGKKNTDDKCNPRYVIFDNIHRRICVFAKER